MVCPVMGHKSGGIGTRALVARGLRPDYCINTENSGVGIARAAVGVVKFLIHAYSKPVFFSSPTSSREAFMNPYQQLGILMSKMGTCLRGIRPGGWLTFQLNEELPDYPQLNFDSVTGDYMRTNRVTLETQIRIVPGQSGQSVRDDLDRLIASARKEFPNLQVELELPPKTGQYAGWDWPAFSTPADAPLVVALERWHTYAAGRPPIIGSSPRLGAVGDGNFLAAAGTEVVEYGPGSSQEYAQWPTPNERISMDEVAIATKAMALTTAALCR